MTYHHYNRLLDHYSGKLTPSERLIALYLSQAIREKTNLYSESVRRICQHLDLSEAGVKRSLKNLEEAGVFKVEKSYLATYARSYQLAVSCPEECLHLEDHNTKRELANLDLNATRRIKLNPPSYQIEPPYIETLKEEEEIVYLEGEEELGLLVQILKEGSLDLTGQQLLEATETHPRQLAKALVQITKKANLDSSKRKRTYLERIVKTTPQTLLKTLEETKALEIGKQLLTGSQERAFEIVNGKQRTKTNQLPRAHTNKRLHLWLAKNGYSNLEESHYIERQAIEGKLTPDHLIVNDEILKALNDNLYGFFKTTGTIKDWRDYFYLSASDEDLRPELRPRTQYWAAEIGFLTEISSVVPELITAEETPAYDLREAKLLELKRSWLEANPDKEIQDFRRSVEMGIFFKENPPVLSTEEFAKRYLAKINFVLGTIPDFSYFSGGQHYQAWLEESFTWEDDLRDVLDQIPARLEGHNAHLAKFEEAYLEVRAKASQVAVLNVLTDFGQRSKPAPSQYALSPDKYLRQELASFL
jgi:DNA-binding Lrp family transcriptional regulator